MALIRSVLPPAVRKAMIAGMPRFLRLGDLPAEVLLEARVGQFYSMKAFTLGLEDVKGPGIRAARPAGWRFLAQAPEFPAIAGVITQTHRGVRPRMTSLIRGPQVANVFQAAREIESLLAAEARDYQMGILSVPGLLIEGFWLKSKGGRSGSIIPFHSACPQIQSMWLYPMRTCIRIMRPLVDEFRAFGH